MFSDPGATPDENGDAENVTPMYVCPGAKDEAFDYTFLLYGDGLSRMIPCPARDCCRWYGSYDLGGEHLYTDFPPGMRISAQFKDDPYFSCPRFQDMSRKERGGRKGPGKWPPAGYEGAAG
jgi:hypothetical protein